MRLSCRTRAFPNVQFLEIREILVEFQTKAGKSIKHTLHTFFKKYIYSVKRNLLKISLIIMKNKELLNCYLGTVDDLTSFNKLEILETRIYINQN